MSGIAAMAASCDQDQENGSHDGVHFAVDVLAHDIFVRRDFQYRIVREWHDDHPKDRPTC